MFRAKNFLSITFSVAWDSNVIFAGRAWLARYESLTQVQVHVVPLDLREAIAGPVGNFRGAER